MGQKTTAFISDIMKYQDDCRQFIVDYGKANLSLDKIADKNIEILSAFGKRMQELIKEHGDKESANEAATTDKLILGFQEQIGELDKSLHENSSKLRDAKDGLYLRVRQLGTKLVDLNNFIQKKKTSWKSKKSLPSAEEWYKTASVFHKNTVEQLKNIT